MKKLSIFLGIASLAVCSCIGGKPQDVLIPVEAVETAGPAFNSIVIAGDAMVYADESPIDPKQLFLKASVPCVKASGARLFGVGMTLDLVDANGAKIISGFEAEGLGDILPVLDAGEGVSRNILFVSSLPLDKASAGRALDKAARLRVNVTGAPVVDSARPAPDDAPSGPPTLNTLIKKYNAWGLLAEYERALKLDNKNLRKAAEHKIKYAKERADKEYSDALSDKFDDWIEDRMDKIDDKY